VGKQPCKGLSINNVREGARAVPKKNFRQGGEGCKKSRKIDDIIYGWSLSRNHVSRGVI
jgi:hypothetical protein